MNRLAGLSLSFALALPAVCFGQAGASPAPELFQGVAVETLLARARASLDALGPYRARLLKQERINGKLQPLQEIAFRIRPRPYAVQGEFLAGPARGRRILYNAELRPDEVLVREAGMLGWAGSIWLKRSSGLTRKDTHYAITDTGLGRLLEIFEQRLLQGQRSGKLERTDEGWDASGNWCLRLTLPHQKSRVCFDALRTLPVRLENEDDAGVLERFTWVDVTPISPETPELFTAAAAGL